MTDTAVKMCSKNCGRKLRRNNRSGVCYVCTGSAKGREAAPSAIVPKRNGAHAERLLLPIKAKGKAASSKGSPVDKFKVVADALGFDGQGMLNRYAQAQLDILRGAFDAGHAARGVTVTSTPLAPKAPTVRLRANNAPVAASSAGSGESDHGSRLDDD